MARGELAEVQAGRRGGVRAGAGRKPGTGRRPMPHRSRPPHTSSHPVHVTLRSCFRPLRHPFVFPTVRAAIAAVSRQRSTRPVGMRRVRHDFRIVHFSVQADHIHLIVEARDKRTLSNAVRGLSVSIARRLNALVNRTGPVFADRWHGRALTTPRAVRTAVVYVLGNHRKHGSQRGGVDPYSSAPYFDGFRESRGTPPFERDARCVPRALAPPESERPVALAPTTWLLRVAWRQRGSISIDESPAIVAKRSYDPMMAH